MIRFDVNSAPHAKRARGPKQLAEAAPTKNSPGTEVSKWELSTGVSSAARIWRERPGSRNFRTLQRHAVTRATDDVIGDDLARRAVLSDAEVDLVAAHLGRLQLDAQMGGEAPFDLVAHEPARRRSQVPADHAMAKVLRQAMEQQRSVHAEPRSPPDTDARTRPLDSLHEGARLYRGVVKCDFLRTRHQLHLGADLVQDGGDVDGGGAPSDHDDMATSKSREIRVPRAVRDDCLGQTGEGRGQISEVGDAGGHDDAAGRHDLAGLTGGLETTRGSLDRGEIDLVDLGDEALLELQTVRDEALDRHGNSDISVRPLRFSAIVGQRE